MEVKEKPSVRHQQNVAIIVGTLSAINDEILQLLSELFGVGEFLLYVRALGDFRLWVIFRSKIDWCLCFGGCGWGCRSGINNYHFRATATAPTEAKFWTTGHTLRFASR